MKQVYPFFMFTNCQAEEALNLYVSLFENAKIEELTRWSEESPIALAGKIQSALFTIGGVTFRFMDSTGHDHSLTPSTSIFVVCDNESELHKAYNGLIDGGKELMPLGEYPFATLFAWVQDKYGLNWQLSLD